MLPRDPAWSYRRDNWCSEIGLVGECAPLCTNTLKADYLCPVISEGETSFIIILFVHSVVSVIEYDDSFGVPSSDFEDLHSQIRVYVTRKDRVSYHVLHR